MRKGLHSKHQIYNRRKTAQSTPKVIQPTSKFAGNKKNLESVIYKLKTDMDNCTKLKHDGQLHKLKNDGQLHKIE